MPTLRLTPLGIVNQRNQSVQWGSKTHKAAAASTPALRLSLGEATYYNPMVGRFVRRTGAVVVAGLRHKASHLLEAALASGAVLAPAGWAYNPVSSRFVKAGARPVVSGLLVGPSDANARVKWYVREEEVSDAVPTFQHIIHNGYVWKLVKEATYQLSQVEAIGVPVGQPLQYGDDRLRFALLNENFAQDASNLASTTPLALVESMTPVAAPAVEPYDPMAVVNQATTVAQHISDPYTNSVREEYAGYLGGMFESKEPRLENGCGLVIHCHTLGRAITAAQSAKPRPRYVGVEPDFAHFWQLCRPDEPFTEGAGGYGLTLEEFGRPFVHYRIPLTVLDTRNQVIQEACVRPEKPNTNLPGCRHVYVKQHNGHLYLLSENIDSLSKQALKTRSGVVFNDALAGTEAVEPADVKEPTASYRLRDKQERPWFFMTDVNELATMPLPEVEKGKPAPTVEVITPIHLQSILAQLLRASYEPYVGMEGGRATIMCLGMRINGVRVSIRNTDNPAIPEVGFNSVETAEEYETYRAWDDELYHSLLTRGTMSHYSEAQKNILAMAPPPLCGTLTQRPSGDVFAVDTTRAYTSFLSELTAVPVLLPWDELEEYQGEELEPHSLYLAAGSDLPLLFAKGQEYLYPGHCLMKLRDMDPLGWYGVSIRWVLRPARVAPTNIGEVIRRLYASPLACGHRKFLVNKLVGLCGKKYNSKSNTRLFTSPSEAWDWAGSAGAARKRLLPVGEGLNYHLMCQFRQRDLDCGFLPIQASIYAMMRVKLHEMALAVKQVPVAVRTDCLYFAAQPAGIPHATTINKRSVDALGSFSWEAKPAKDMPSKPVAIREPHSAPVWEPRKKQRDISIADEWALDEFKAAFDAKDKVMVKADIAGAGKTTALKRWAATLEGGALFVAPYNTLCDDFRREGLQATTVYGLLGLTVSDSGDTNDDKAKVRATAGTMVLDEFYSYPLELKLRLARFMAANPSCRFYATGDVNQLEPPGDDKMWNGIADYDAYTERVVAALFPRTINLREVKRVADPGMRDKMYRIRDDVLRSDKPLADIVRDHCLPTTVLRGRGVCYYNTTRERVAAKAHKAFMAAHPEIDFKPGGYYTDQTLICRKRLRVGKATIHTNFQAVIKRFEGASAVLSWSGVEAAVPLKQLGDHFIYNYAATGHSAQGLSVDGPITIYDIQSRHICRKWLYVALTRARDPSQLFYYAGSSRPTATAAQVVESKLAHYRAQDATAGRYWSDGEFITVEQVMAMEPVCHCCGAACEWVYEAGDLSQWTLDRIDNAVAHTATNCRIACLSCNAARK